MPTSRKTDQLCRTITPLESTTVGYMAVSLSRLTHYHVCYTPVAQASPSPMRDVHLSLEEDPFGVLMKWIHVRYMPMAQ